MPFSKDNRHDYVVTGYLPTGASRIVELDALRGIAILVVVIFHYFVIAPGVEHHAVMGPVAKWLCLTWVGVDLFFVLSGFLIGSILLQHRDSENYFIAFYARRAARLFPLYFFVLVTYLVAKPLLLAYPSEAGAWLVKGEGDALPWWSYFLYLQNFFIASGANWGGHWLAPTWSLAVEEQFYLIAPALIAFIPRQRLKYWIVGLIVLSVLYRTTVFISAGNWIPGYVLLPSRADGLLVGLLGALMCADRRTRAWFAEHPRELTRALQLSAAILFALSAAAISAPHYLMATAGHTLLAVMSLTFVLAAIFTETWFTRAILRNALLIELGGLSYAVYLLHQPVRGLVHLLIDGGLPQLSNWSDALIAVLALALTVVLALLSKIWLERPFLQIGQRIKYGQRSRQSPVVLV